jgi:hypothetical protein
MNMNKSVIKCHLYFFEIISFLTTIWVFSTLLLYVLIIRFSSGINPKNHITAEVEFTVNVEHSLFIQLLHFLMEKGL